MGTENGNNGMYFGNDEDYFENGGMNGGGDVLGYEESEERAEEAARNANLLMSYVEKADDYICVKASLEKERDQLKRQLDERETYVESLKRESESARSRLLKCFEESQPLSAEIIALQKQQAEYHRKELYTGIKLASAEATLHQVQDLLKQKETETQELRHKMETFGEISSQLNSLKHKNAEYANEVPILKKEIKDLHKIKEDFEKNLYRSAKLIVEIALALRKRQKLPRRWGHTWAKIKQVAKLYGHDFETLIIGQEVFSDDFDFRDHHSEADHSDSAFNVSAMDGNIQPRVASLPLPSTSRSERNRENVSLVKPRNLVSPSSSASNKVKNDWLANNAAPLVSLKRPIEAQLRPHVGDRLSVAEKSSNDKEDDKAGRTNRRYSEINFVRSTGCLKARPTVLEILERMKSFKTLPCIPKINEIGFESKSISDEVVKSRNDSDNGETIERSMQLTDMPSLQFSFDEGSISSSVKIVEGEEDPNLDVDEVDEGAKPLLIDEADPLRVNIIENAAVQNVQIRNIESSECVVSYQASCNVEPTDEYDATLQIDEQTNMDIDTVAGHDTRIVEAMNIELPTISEKVLSSISDVVETIASNNHFYDDPNLERTFTSEGTQELNVVDTSATFDVFHDDVGNLVTKNAEAVPELVFGEAVASLTVEQQMEKEAQNAVVIMAVQNEHFSLDHNDEVQVSKEMRSCLKRIIRLADRCDSSNLIELYIKDLRVLTSMNDESLASECVVHKVCTMVYIISALSMKMDRKSADLLVELLRNIFREDGAVVSDTLIKRVVGEMLVHLSAFHRTSSVNIAIKELAEKVFTTPLLRHKYETLLHSFVT